MRSTDLCNSLVNIFAVILSMHSQCLICVLISYSSLFFTQPSQDGGHDVCARPSGTILEWAAN
ncbi:hypothetical protein JZ751_007050 [Albula glossodonta]|uniref:Uncharacterized protein n=1 Tax=Albula glossodonta TaxID=121402 RepID=A0A8T2P4W0_9TELE|nr:hypothetical protein JZ751_007050 [Albula glossodonta]